MDERELIRRVESSDPSGLAELLNRATPTEERVLEDYLGAERYRRMRRLATRVGTGPGPESRGFLKDLFGGGTPNRNLGNVVFLPGIMGSELSVATDPGAGSTVWLNLWRIAQGQIGRLRLARDGLEEFEPGLRVRPTGLLKRYYGEIALSLARSWNVKTFWYDWRKDLDLAADSLHAWIGEWFPRNAPVHLVAHSMGGLVSRTFIHRYPERWATMWDARDAGARGGRLIMLGTPNHGSFLVPQMVTGLASTIRKLALADLTRDLAGVLEVLNSFVGAWQMLPSPASVPEAEALYQTQTWEPLNVNPALLKNARKHHEALADVVDPARMVYVAGKNQPTHAKILDYRKIREPGSYEMTFLGDGSVPHSLGLLTGVTTYFVEAEHSALTSNAKVLGSLDALLLGQVPVALEGGQPVRRGLPEKDHEQEATTRKQKAAQVMAERQEEEVKQFAALLARMRSRGMGQREAELLGATVTEEILPPVTETERRLEEELVRGFLCPSDRGDPVVQPADAPAETKVEIEVALILGSIDALDNPRPAGPPLDAIAIGHYLGVRPAAAELRIDRAISQDSRGVGSRNGKLVLTEFTDRNILRGMLGQPFFLDDPRPGARRAGAAGRRIIAVAGMGRPGSFGVPELIILSRELCWSLGRLRRTHLASVLIGSGNGNIPTAEAVEAWLTGLAGAVGEAARDGDHRLKRLTLVEYDPQRIREIDKAIRRTAARADLGRKVKVVYKGLQILRDKGAPRPFPVIDEAADKRIDALIITQLSERFQEDRDAVTRGSAAANATERDKRNAAARRDATRLNVEFRPIPGQIVGIPPTALQVSSRARYIFSAITESASVPEREIVIDPRLIEEANNKLPAESALARQFEIGKVLGRLLLPEELAPHLNSPAPLVLTVDTNTARIHWEMVAQPVGATDEGDPLPRTDDEPRQFLGTFRTVTRQFRTSFADLPSPSRAPGRELRVLIVADPAGGPDALVGARDEGMAVADLFERFHARSATHGTPRVIVTSLIGPREANRYEVMSRLLNEQYDLLHFAGHCYFNAEDTSASGWIFDQRQVLSANELRRVKQVPRFVFSNACESGITPDRSRDRSDLLSPSFAEAFFARGVANFVCTAWPVDDATALRFARRLYCGLLGFDPEKPESSHDPLPMHRAMQEARLEVIKDPIANDTRTWGAYQHYGNPHFRMIDAATTDPPPGNLPAKTPAAPSKTKAARARARPKRSSKRSPS